MRHARVDSSLTGAMHLVPFSSMYSEPVLPPPKYAQMIPAHVNKYGINCRESVMAGRPGKTRVVPAHQGIIMNGVQYFTFFLSRGIFRHGRKKEGWGGRVPHVRLGKKEKSVSFSRVYVCVKAKLTLVSFFYFFFAPSP